MSVQVRNPHSVLAALKARPQDVLSITLTPALAESDTPWGSVAKLARERGIRVEIRSGGGFNRDSRPDRSERNDRGGRGGPAVKAQAKVEEGGRMGNAEATIKERAGISVEELFRGAKTKADGKGLWLALDCLQDPHNVGAIFRTAAFFGVQGILLTQERSAPLTGTVYDIASGGMESVPFSTQINLRQAFDAAKDAGLWILGTSEHAKDDLSKIAADRPWLAVLGNEEKGMRRLTEESCDVLCGINPKTKSVTSLNVSVAAGIIISRLG